MKDKGLHIFGGGAVFFGLLEWLACLLKSPNGAVKGVRRATAKRPAQPRRRLCWRESSQTAPTAFYSQCSPLGKP
jgi:hypothetical protein